MTYAVLEEKLKLMPEECLKELLEYADYLLFRYPKRHQEEDDSQNGDFEEFFGTMDLGDGLELQKRWRDEWD